MHKPFLPCFSLRSQTTFLLFAVAACSQEVLSEQLSVGKNQAAIIDGERESEANEVFFIVANEQLCTGTLIAPRVVLTAKHCVHDAAPDSVYIGMGKDFWSGTMYDEVQEVRIWPGEDLANTDIALLMLAHGGELTPRAWLDDASLELTHAEITAVGFGQQKTGKPNTSKYGYKMRSRTVIVSQSENEFVVAGPTTCFGDSGGPAILSDGRVAGVVSRGTEECKSYSIYTRTSAFSDWIWETIAETGGPGGPTPDGEDEGEDSNQGLSADESLMDDTDESADPVSTSDAEDPISGEPGLVPNDSGCSVTSTSSTQLPMFLVWVVMVGYLARFRFARSQRLR